jgi:hypothetical protein
LFEINAKMDSPSLPLPSTTTTLTIEALPAEIIVNN